jgi:hypothetical protein
MTELNKVCLLNNIHIEDIPTFALKLMKHKVPFSTERDRQYDYSLDDLKIKLEEFLNQKLHSMLHPHQKEAIKKGIKLHGRVLFN